MTLVFIAWSDGGGGKRGERLTQMDGLIGRKEGGKEAFTRGEGEGDGGKRPPEIRSPIPDFPQIPNIKAEKGKGRKGGGKEIIHHSSRFESRSSLRSLSRSDSPEIAAEFLPISCIVPPW